MMSKQNQTADLEIFCQQWQKHKDYLYACCFTWMGNNPTDAEDALSETMLKAIDYLRKSDRPIENFKAWFTTLAYNLCMSIHRQRSRNPMEVAIDIEAIAPDEWVTQAKISDPARSRDLELLFRHAVDNLPSRLRETFQLYLQKKYSLKEIAVLQNISYANVRKRISQARKILQQQWHDYEAGKLSISSPPQQSVKNPPDRTQPVEIEQFLKKRLSRASTVISA